MKPALVCFLVAFVTTSFVLAQSKEWTNTKDLELAYKVDFPGKPVKRTQGVPTAKGEVEMITYSLSSEDTDNFVYMGAYTKYPTSFFPDGLDTFEKQHKVLDGAVNGAATNVNGKILSDTKITFNGYNGREVKIGVESQGLPFVMRMKMLLAGFELYMVQTISSQEKDNNPDTARFFDSFELINVNSN